MAPTAKTPTAMERTTSAVRALLPARSRTTFCHRGLNTDHLQRAGGVGAQHGRGRAGERWAVGRGEGARTVADLLDDLPVGDDDGAAGACREITVVGDHEDRLTVVNEP